MSSQGAAADAARRDVRELIEAKGHVVDNARGAIARLDAAFAAGELQRTPALVQFLADLEPALEQALASGRTTVVDARVDPAEQCFPMIPAGAAAVDMVEYEEPAEVTAA